MGQVLVADLAKFVPDVIESSAHSGDSFTPAILRIAGRCGADGDSTVVLSRKNRLPWFISGGRAKGMLDQFMEKLKGHLPKELRDSVLVSSVHKFKGQESGVVVVADAIEQRN